MASMAAARLLALQALRALLVVSQGTQHGGAGPNLSTAVSMALSALQGTLEAVLGEAGAGTDPGRGALYDWYGMRMAVASEQAEVRIFALLPIDV